MPLHRKVLIFLFLLVPSMAAATTAVPWSITNLTDTFIFPNLVNGSAKGILVSASSTVNSTLTVSSLTSGNCVQASTGGLLTTIATPCGSGSGTVTQINTTFPILGGPITTTGTISFGGLSSTSPWTTGQSVYVVNGNTLASTPTTTVSCSGSASCLPFTVFGPSPFTITATGGAATSSFTATYPVQVSTSPTINYSLAFGTTTSNTWAATQTFTNSPVFSTLGAGTVNSLANGTIYSTGTSTPTVSSPLTYTGILGSFIGGVAGAFGCPTCVTTGTATSTITGTQGQVVYMQGTNSPIGTSSIFIDTNSNVGIGTVSPTSLLHISRSDDATLSPSLRMDQNGIGDVFEAFSIPGTHNYSVGLAANGNFSIAYKSSSIGGLTSGSRINITPTGNVGIGIALGQSNKLDVNGSASIGTYSNFSAPANGLIVSGDVGIATTSPGSRFSIGSIANFTTATSSFYTTGGLDIAAGCYAVGGACLTTGSLGLTGTTGQVAYFIGTNLAVGTSSIFITPLGNVGIGTTSPGVFTGSQSPLTVAVTNSLIKPAITISNSNSATSYAQMAFAGSGATWLEGVGNGSETLFGVANKWYLLSPTALTMVADTSGNVGIGTSSPGGRLGVTGANTGATLGFVVADSNNSPILQVQNNNITSLGQTFATTTLNIRPSVDGGGIILQQQNNNCAGIMQHINNSDGSISWSRYLNTSCGGHTDTELMRLQPGVGLGIGMIPEAGLSVTGGFPVGATNPGVHLGVQGNLAGGQLYGTSGTTFDYAGTSGRDYDFRQIFQNSANSMIWQASTTANQFVIHGNGNVGVGTATPPVKFAVSSGSSGGTPNGSSVASFETPSGGYVSLITASNAEEGFLFGLASNNVDGGIIYNNQTDNGQHGIQFRTNGNSTKMTIASTGNVGIGTTTPGGKLTVDAGGTRGILIGVDADATAYNAISLSGNLSDANILGILGGGGTDNNLYFKVPSSGYYVFNSSSVGIGDATPDALLDVAGTLMVDGVVTFNDTTAAGVGDVYMCKSAGNVVHYGATCAASTKEIKKNVTPATDALSLINKLRPVNYQYKNGFYGGVQTTGFLAEEAFKVSPLFTFQADSDQQFKVGDATTTIKKGSPYAIRFDVITAYLTKAVQEITARLTGIESKQNRQEKEIELLKQQVKELQAQIKK